MLAHSAQRPTPSRFRSYSTRSYSTRRPSTTRPSGPRTAHSPLSGASGTRPGTATTATTSSGGRGTRSRRPWTPTATSTARSSRPSLSRQETRAVYRIPSVRRSMAVSLYPKYFRAACYKLRKVIELCAYCFGSQGLLNSLVVCPWTSKGSKNAWKYCWFGEV